MKLAQFILCSASLLYCYATGFANHEKPNVIIIYGDDVGYGDVSAYGSEKIQTPNIDKLAYGGLRFTDAHASAATCTPSRFSLLTGIHGFRQGVDILPPNAPLTIKPSTYTLADLFTEAGYTTAVIGKWHLGLGSKGSAIDWNQTVKPGPLELGFDYSFLLPSTNDRVPCVYLENHHVVNLGSEDPLYVGHTAESVNQAGSTQYPDGKTNRQAMTYYPSTHGHNNSVINGIGRIGYMSGGRSALWDDETMADTFVYKARQFIQQNKDHPFFLYYASQDIHVPRAPHPRFRGKTKLGYRGDAMVQLDYTVGALVACLEEHGLRDNTIIIFSSDNGPVYDDGYEDGTTVKESNASSDSGHYAAGPHRGGKYQIYEGGTRVPFIVSWPKRIQPAITDALVNQIDLLASFASYLQIDLTKDVAPDSRNLWSALTGESPIGLSFMVEEAQKTLALRQGDWKFIRKHNKPNELYNLAEDLTETKNLIRQHPGIAEKMALQLSTCIQSSGLRNLSN